MRSLHDVLPQHKALLIERGTAGHLNLQREGVRGSEREGERERERERERRGGGEGGRDYR